VRFAGATLLSIHFTHAITAGALESPHKDPFDRMPAAQCLEEDLSCVTRDPFFASAGVHTIW
jgi:PIN domain nuclease of toxin-antitoxin system